MNCLKQIESSLNGWEAWRLGSLEAGKQEGEIGIRSMKSSIFQGS
ncbi:hypothetical protein D1AOALGA4SA_9092 [Olavius algarvensis Delta 1 endosymbiont]|nr:hypothetical protein D1AOALGA4SA_9092 [Olavius algarvensis Delta 1 endosymbiont]